MSEQPSSTIVVHEGSMAPAAVQARIAYAKNLAASSLLPDAYRQQPANVLLAIEYGQSLGIKPIAALNGINVIKGKPTMSADLMASVVRKAGHRLRVKQEGMSVRAQLIRSDDPEFIYEAVWDEARARRAQLWGQRGPWSLYPEQMLRSRAITEVCRQGASDCLYGVVYSPEEIGGEERGHGADDYLGPDDQVAQLRQECEDMVHRFVRKFGGDPEQIAQEWMDQGGTANPPALTAWLTARIPQPQPQSQSQPQESVDVEVVEGEIIEEENTND